MIQLDVERMLMHHVWHYDTSVSNEHTNVYLPTLLHQDNPHASPLLMDVLDRVNSGFEYKATLSSTSQSRFLPYSVYWLRALARRISSHLGRITKCILKH